MLYLKKANYEDIEEEFNFMSKMKSANGFENPYINISRNEFKEKCLDEIIGQSNGNNLPEGYVPNTYFYLWDDNKIVGLFKIRHYLNEHLKNGSGHIGYGILEEHRGKGYATKGLALAIEECKKIIPENEIYHSVHKDNPSSLKVQQNNGAYIVGENAEEYLTRIKI